jgi:DNA-binding transcriptional LysR family regulator
VAVSAAGPASIALVVDPRQRRNRFGRYAGEILRAEGIGDVAEVALADLAGETFVEREGGSGTLESLRRALKAHGAALPPHRVALRAGSTQSQLAAVRAGAGVAFVSARAVGEGLAAVRIAGLPLRRELYVCHDPERCPPVARAFLAFATARRQG